MIIVLPRNSACINAIKCLALFTVSILLLLRADAQQNMVISNTGQTGTSGTNWNTTGTNPVTITGTGAAAINTSVITGYLNAGTSVILNNTSVGTAINADIIKTAGGNASLTVKDLGNVKIAAAVTVSSTSNRLDIILWSDDDNNQGGTVDDFVYINQGVTLSSNGGKIILAGGPDDGSNGGVSGDGIPDGFPWNGSNSTTYGANTIGGLTLGIPGGTGPVITLNSGGGDILLRGSTSNNNGYPGITSQGNLKIDAGIGKITIYGKSSSGQGIELSFGAPPAIAINSSSTSSPAIDIKGTSTATGFAGFFASNNSNGNMLIQSTAASGGGISIEGTNPTGYGILLGVSGTSITSQIISQSGSIALTGKGTTNTSLVFYGDSYIGNRKDATAVQGITPVVSVSQSNLLLQGDDQWKFSNTASKNTNISTAGSLTMQAYTAGYTGLVNWTGTAVFGSSFGSITMGKSTENYSFTLNNSLTASGNITAYVNDFLLSDGIGLASSGAGMIAINANGNFGTTGTTRRTISTVNGTINIFADADANGFGQLDVDYLTMNPGSGNTTVRCETMSWAIAANSDKPYFNGTGSVTIEPSDPAFQDVNTQWFYFDQDANGMAGLTIGKPTNTSNIVHQVSPLSIAGPISLYGGSLQLDVNLTSTAGGNISLFGNSITIGAAAIFSSSGNLVIAPITAGTTIGLAGIGTLNLSAANFTTNFADGFAAIIIGSGSAGAITLGAILTVRDNWQLATAGNLLLNETLDINTNNLRFVGTGITPATGKFIKTNGTGRLIMDIGNNSTKLFPVGVSYYNPLSITNHIGNADTFSATVSDAVYSNGSTSGTAVSWNPRVNLTWNISNAGTSTGAGDVDLQFGWNAANEIGVFTVPRLLNYGGTQWNLLPATPAADLVGRSLTYTGYTGNFSSFAIAESNALLPVNWLLFTGKQNGSSVALAWATAAATSNDHFEVQHSPDGIVFSSIGNMKAYGSFSNDRQDYSFTDNNPFAPRTFYRIRQVDIDGKFSYSKIIVVQAVESVKYQITHVRGSGQVFIAVPQSVTGTVILTIADAGGRILLQQSVGAGHTIIHADNLLAGGIYVANLRRGGAIVYTTRLLK